MTQGPTLNKDTPTRHDILRRQRSDLFLGKIKFLSTQRCEAYSSVTVSGELKETRAR